MDDPIVRREGDGGLDAAAVLADPVGGGSSRTSSTPRLRSAATRRPAAAGIGRSLAGYHLDQLVDGGPARRHLRPAQRPERTRRRTAAKLYEPAPLEVTVQLPPRDDTLVAHLLATAIEADPIGSGRAVRCSNGDPGGGTGPGAGRGR